jgi:hypothetical protein
MSANSTRKATNNQIFIIGQRLHGLARGGNRARRIAPCRPLRSGSQHRGRAGVRRSIGPRDRAGQERRLPIMSLAAAKILPRRLLGQRANSRWQGAPAHASVFAYPRRPAFPSGAGPMGLVHRRDAGSIGRCPYPSVTRASRPTTPKTTTAPGRADHASEIDRPAHAPSIAMSPPAAKARMLRPEFMMRHRRLVHSPVDSESLLATSPTRRRSGASRIDSRDVDRCTGRTLQSRPVKYGLTGMGTGAPRV